LTHAFEIDVPTGWRSRRDVAPMALAARPPDRDGAGGFVPNLLVLDARAEAPTAGFDRYAVVQLEAIAAPLQDPLLVAVERAESADGRPALDLLVAHVAGGHDVTLYQRHVLHPGGRALVASATVADGEWPELAAVCTRAVRSVRVAP